MLCNLPLMVLMELFLRMGRHHQEKPSLVLVQIMRIKSRKVSFQDWFLKFLTKFHKSHLTLSSESKSQWLKFTFKKSKIYLISQKRMWKFAKANQKEFTFKTSQKNMSHLQLKLTEYFKKVLQTEQSHKQIWMMYLQDLIWHLLSHFIRITWKMQVQSQEK